MIPQTNNIHANHLPFHLWEYNYISKHNTQQIQQKSLLNSDAGFWRIVFDQEDKNRLPKLVNYEEEEDKTIINDVNWQIGDIIDFYFHTFHHW